MEWRKLPVEGLVVDDIKIFGNGKDCEITIRTKEPAKKIVQFMMRDPDLEIELRGRIKTVIFNDGHDTYLGTKYIPLEELKIELCEIEYPGDAKEWELALSNFEKGYPDFVGWMIYRAKLRIISIGS